MSGTWPWTPGAIPTKRNPGDEITSCFITVEAVQEYGNEGPDGKWRCLETKTERYVCRAWYNFAERAWYTDGYLMHPNAGKVIAWVHEPKPYQS